MLLLYLQVTPTLVQAGGDFFYGRRYNVYFRQQGDVNAAFAQPIHGLVAGNQPQVVMMLTHGRKLRRHRRITRLQHPDAVAVGDQFDLKEAAALVARRGELFGLA